MSKKNAAGADNENFEKVTRRHTENGESAAGTASAEAAEAAGAGPGDIPAGPEGGSETSEAPGTGASVVEAPEAPEEDPLTTALKDLASERDKYLRLAAEYDNYRKRSAKERETLYGDARADTVIRLLPVYDNLERALKMECADEAFYKGVEMTMTQLTEILEGMKVKGIPAVGEVFDPARHDAVMSVEDPELGEKIVTEECKKGFTLGERVIRHSTVVVAN